MTLNAVGEMVLSETDMVNALYQNKSVLSDIIVDDENWINQYNDMMKFFDLSDDTIEYRLASTADRASYVDQCVGEDGWHMPDDYKHINVYDHLINKTTNKVQEDRVKQELVEYEKRNMLPVLKFLIYFIDTLEQHGVIWGVGRGSSVASYVLFLLKVHRIDSLKYDLDIKEFLK